MTLPAAVSEKIASPRAAKAVTARTVTAMLQAGAGALISGLFAATAIKIIAALLGAGAVAVLQTLQQIRQTALIAATANGQTALVQGISSRSGRARREYARAILCVFAATTMMVAAAL